MYLSPLTKFSKRPFSEGDGLPAIVSRKLTFEGPPMFPMFQNQRLPVNSLNQCPGHPSLSRQVNQTTSRERRIRGREEEGRDREEGPGDAIRALPTMQPHVKSEGHRKICDILLPELFSVLNDPLYANKTPREQVREACYRTMPFQTTFFISLSSNYLVLVVVLKFLNQSQFQIPCLSLLS